MRLLLSIVVVAVGFAVVAGTGSADWNVTRVSYDTQVVMLVGGCDGLIAEGGVPVNDSSAAALYTHNFIASIHVEGLSKFDPDTHRYLSHYRVTGGGSDAADHAFTVEGTLTYDSQSTPGDFWASDGKITVRRDDGAFARGQAQGADSPVVAPPLTESLSAIIIYTADQCHL
jgi:hypothetical protein